MLHEAKSERAASFAFEDQRRRAEPAAQAEHRVDALCLPAREPPGVGLIGAEDARCDLKEIVPDPAQESMIEPHLIAAGQGAVLRAGEGGELLRAQGAFPFLQSGDRRHAQFRAHRIRQADGACGPFPCREGEGGGQARGGGAGLTPGAAPIGSRLNQ